MPDARAGDHLDRARRGEDVTKLLLADLRSLSKRRSFSREDFALRRAIRLAMFGSASIQAVRIAVQDAVPTIAGRLALKAVIFREPERIAIPFPKNPWGIARTMTVEAAVTHVWLDLREAHALAEELARRTVALAYFEGRAKEPVLGYVLYRERDNHEVPEKLRDARRPPFARSAALAWELFGDLALTFGRAPVHALSKLPRGVVVPDALARLYAVHGGLFGGLWRLVAPRDLMVWTDMVGPGHDHLLDLFSYGDDRSELLDISKRIAAPPVLAWSDGGLRTKKGPSLWKWLEKNIPVFTGQANV